jgi:hypothetical protein
MDAALRGAPGARACINFIKGRFVVQQPLFSVSYNPTGRAKAGGGGIAARF